MIFEHLLWVKDPEPHGGAFNMALDEVLLRTATEPILRVYSWRAPTLSFGYFGRMAEVQRLLGGREPVRRWTGGGMVPHGEDFTYTLIVPRSHLFYQQAAAQSYRAIHLAVAAALQGEGVPAALTDGAPKRSEECFTNPAPHDVLADGLKVAGGAQRRTRAGLLHQGSIQRAGLSAAFAGALAAVFGQRVLSRSLSGTEHDHADLLTTSKYGTPQWLERR